MNRVSRSHRQGNEKEQQMTDTSGPTSGKQFAYYDRDSRSWRMWPATGLWGSIEYSETWPRTGFMSDGRAFELPTSAPPTTASDCSSSHGKVLPTPDTNPGGGGPLTTAERRAQGRTASVFNAVMEMTPVVGNQVKTLPTPRTTDSHGPGRHGTGGQDLRTVVAETWAGAPTPKLSNDGSD